MYTPIDDANNTSNIRTINWIKTSLGKYILSQEMSILLKLLLEMENLDNYLVIGEIEFFLACAELLDSIDKTNNTIGNHAIIKKAKQFILYPYLKLNDNGIKESIIDIEYSSLYTTKTKFNILDISFLQQTEIVEKKKILKLKEQLIVALPHQLPINNNIIHLIYLPHILEICYNYFDILSEVYRILKPGGRIVITGFNKNIFCWGIRKLISKLSGHKLYPVSIDCCRNIFTLKQLKYYLITLGFDDIKIQYSCYNLFVNNSFLLKHFKFLEKIGKFFPFINANIYVLSACKRITPLTTIYSTTLHDIMLDNNDLVKNILKS